MPEPYRHFSSRLQSRMLCGFYGKAAGEHRISAQYTEDYSIVYLLEGGGVYRDEQTTIHFEPGWVVQRLPGRAHEIIYDTERRMRNASIHLPYAAHELMSQTGVKTAAIPAFDAGLRHELVLRYDEIINELTWQPEERLFTTLAKMQALVTDLHGFADENQMRRSPRIQQACRYIEEHINDGISVTDISSAIHMSSSHFRRVFRDETGVPPYQYLIQCRIRSAQRLLCTTDMTIGEIADFLGFGNQFALSKQFCDVCGSTPSQYRRQYGYS